MRVQLTRQEYIWLADLAMKAKEQSERDNQNTPHSMFQLRRDNMADLEAKIRAAIQRDIQRAGRDAR